MKKICFITTVSVTMKSFVIETAKYLHNKSGYDVTLICNPDAEFEKSLPDYLHFIPVSMPRGADLSGFKSIKEFRRIFREQKFDIVQYSTPNAACYASIAAKKEKVPIRLYCQWGIRYVGFSGVARMIFKTLEKLTCNNSTHIRAVSPQNRDFAINEGLYSADKVKVVGNGGTIGVDMAVYDVSKKHEWSAEIRKEYGISKDDFVFGFAGRISRDKGCGELLEAFFKLSEAYGNAKLLIVGPVEDDCGVSAELIDKAKNSDKVVFTGSIPGSEMRKYYSAMDVLVHPTYREGFGMVIQEAGAMSVPVITTKIPGAGEVMEYERSCILVDVKDSEALNGAMTRIIETEGLAESLGRGAYERTKELYDRPIMLEFQREDYEGLIGENE